MSSARAEKILERKLEFPAYMPGVIIRHFSQIPVHFRKNLGSSTSARVSVKRRKILRSPLQNVSRRFVLRKDGVFFRTRSLRKLIYTALTLVVPGIIPMYVEPSLGYGGTFLWSWRRVFLANGWLTPGVLPLINPGGFTVYQQHTSHM